jgi:hypothetical protein
MATEPRTKRFGWATIEVYPNVVEITPTVASDGVVRVTPYEWAQAVDFVGFRLVDEGVDRG